MIKLTSLDGKPIYVSAINYMWRVGRDDDRTLIQAGDDFLYVTETPEEILQPSERERKLAWLVRLAYEEGHKSHSVAPDRSWEDSWSDSRTRELLG